MSSGLTTTTVDEKVLEIMVSLEAGDRIRSFHRSFHWASWLNVTQGCVPPNWGICISYGSYLWLFVPNCIVDQFGEFDESLVRAFVNVITVMYQLDVKTAHYHRNFFPRANISLCYERMEFIIFPTQQLQIEFFL